jgi:type I restriction enzyme, S subunit
VNNIPLRRFVLSACDGPFGSAIKSNDYVENGARVIRLGNIGINEWRDHDRAFLPVDYWRQLLGHHAKPGDIVMAALGDEGNPVGRTCVIPENLGPALVKADCYRIRFDRERVDPRFLSAFLSSSAGLARAAQVAEGATRPRLTLNKALSLPVPDLPLNEQRLIADFLQARVAIIDALIRKNRSMIGLVGERVWASFVERVTEVTSREMPLRRALRGIHDGPFGSAFSSSDYSDEGAYVVRLGNIGFGEFRHGLRAYIPLEMYHSFLRHQVQQGDLLIAGLGDERNHAGRACVAPDLGPAMVKGLYATKRGERPRSLAVR